MTDSSKPTPTNWGKINPSVEPGQPQFDAGTAWRLSVLLTLVEFG
jgi:hypothetical protein